MLNGLSVIPLRDHPDAISALVRGFEAEWPDWYGPRGRGSAAADLAAFANPAGALPTAVVALDAHGTPVGTAALKASWTTEFAHLTPWASAGWVRPGQRRQGIGAMLLHGLEVEARRLRYSYLFCATATAVTLLEREGWARHAQTVHDSGTLQIFQRTLRTPF